MTILVIKTVVYQDGITAFPKYLQQKTSIAKARDRCEYPPLAIDRDARQNSNKAWKA